MLITYDMNNMSSLPPNHGVLTARLSDYDLPVHQHKVLHRPEAAGNREVILATTKRPRILRHSQ